MRIVRLPVTWEAIEHEGPGLHDDDYLDYVYQLVSKAREHGLYVVIDPHQDVWSRFSGGDGAPGWTLEAAGFDIGRLAATGACVLHSSPGIPYPQLIWSTNREKLAAATMFTLFFGGNDFAPKRRAFGIRIQPFLQSYYLAAFGALARRLSTLQNVIGYEIMNEPAPGYIGVRDLAAPPECRLRLGPMPTPWQGMLAGAGHPQQVETWAMGLLGPKRTGTALLNPEGISAWLPDDDCVWRQHGIWVDIEGGRRLLRRDYFARANFARDYLKPFMLRFIAEVRSSHPQALIFLAGDSQGPPVPWGRSDPGGAVHGGHWYDGAALVLKRFHPAFSVNPKTRWPVLGVGPVPSLMRRQVAELVRTSMSEMGGAPTFVGEFGLPFDLNGGRAFRTGNFSAHLRALDAYYAALDDNLLGGAVWHYAPDNTNRHGDLWNGEDLSIFSRDQQSTMSDINSGGRALRAIVRPYARAVAGVPLRMRFSLATRVFELEFQSDPQVSAPTEIFVPDLQYPYGFEVELSDGRYDIDTPAQMVLVYHTPSTLSHWVRIAPIH
jgi:hypothetical protein